MNPIQIRNHFSPTFRMQALQQIKIQLTPPRQRITSPLINAKPRRKAKLNEVYKYYLTNKESQERYREELKESGIFNELDEKRGK